eukprot:m51a1_g3800 hypothetical protein (266) ;mRNA; f:210498-211383
MESFVNATSRLLTEFEFHEGLPLGQLWMPVVASSLYVPTVFAVRAWARSRRTPVNTHSVSLLYNLFVTVLSFATFWGAFVPLVGRAVTLGPKYSVCNHDGRALTGSMALAGYVYYLSKYLELADTVFLALQGKNLSVLHIYHHAGMPVLTYLFLADGTIIVGWLVWMNSLIHTFMYWYYFQADRGVRVGWKRHMTSAQIVQLLGALASGSANAWYIRAGESTGSLRLILVAMGMDVLLISLFVNFFVHEYLRGKARKAAAEKKLK